MKARVGSTIILCALVYGPERVISIGKELTKIHETILTAPVGEILFNVKKTRIVKGEFVVLIAPARSTL